MDIPQKNILSKVKIYLIYILILLLPFTHKEAYSIFNPDLVWSKFILAGSAILGFIIFFRNYKFFFKNIYFNLMLIYLGFQVLSLFRSEDLRNSLLFIGFFTAILFLFVSVHDFLVKNSIENIIKVYFISIFITLAFLVRQIYLLENLDIETGGVWPVPGYPTRYGSTFWDVNHYGIYLASGLFLILGYLLNKHKISTKTGALYDRLSPIRAKLLLVALYFKSFNPGLKNLNSHIKLSIISITFLIFMLMAFRLTGSRSSLLGLIAGGSIFLIGYFFVRKRLVEVFTSYRMLTSLSLFSLVPIVLLLVFREDVRDAFLYRAVSFYAHLFLLKVGILTGLQNFFLGIGVNAFSEYFKTSIWADSYYYIDRAALNLKLPLHNLWLEAWVETGLFSFVFFALLWIVLIINLFKVYKEKKDYIALGLLSGVITFLVGGMFYSYKSEFFWFYAVVAFAYATIKSQSNLNFDFKFLRSFKPWISLLCVVALIYPLLFFTAPPSLNEISNYYFYLPGNKLFDLWATLLDNFRYVIGNYSFTGRFLIILLYFSAIFSLLSLLRKLNTSFFTALLVTTIVFMFLGAKNPVIIVSFTNFLVYLLIIVSNLFFSILPIRRRIPCELRRQNIIYAVLIMLLFPVSIKKAVEYYENTYDTNLNFLVELAANRSKTNDALIFIQTEEWAALVQYYSDRLEDDEQGKFYMVESYIIPMRIFDCEETVFEPGKKYLFLTDTAFECSRLSEDIPHVSVVKQGNYKLTLYEEKIRNN